LQAELALQHTVRVEVVRELLGLAVQILPVVLGLFFLLDQVHIMRAVAVAGHAMLAALRAV
jgi:hypothetical protein